MYLGSPGGIDRCHHRVNVLSWLAFDCTVKLVDVPEFTPLADDVARRHPSLAHQTSERRQRDTSSCGSFLLSEPRRGHWSKPFGRQLPSAARALARFCASVGVSRWPLFSKASTSPTSQNSTVRSRSTSSRRRNAWSKSRTVALISAPSPIARFPCRIAWPISSACCPVAVAVKASCCRCASP